METVIKKQNNYSLGEELCNAITHGIATLLSIAGLVIAIVISAIYGNAYSVVSSCIYGACLIILFLMSTMYHSLTNKKAKNVFRVLDHCSIFLLIAGTYTPFVLVALNGALGWTMFGIIWGLAIFAIVFNSISVEKFKKINIICCLFMGWLALFTIKPLFESISFNGILLLVLGGVAYSLGVIFYKMKKLKYMHAVWHIFVMLGSMLHFFSIINYVLPIK